MRLVERLLFSAEPRVTEQPLHPANDGSLPRVPSSVFRRWFWTKSRLIPLGDAAVAYFGFVAKVKRKDHERPHEPIGTAHRAVPGALPASEAVLESSPVSLSSPRPLRSVGVTLCSKLLPWSR